ncbi:virulence-associated E family protein [Culicoidibacter larvae]|uniref:Virulence-associated protein E-like domain-containing protein n=1 Tax=Culicoidibacter larvae TaxID=2579976 RepID=A0A5R8Q8D0_9FIRM|nr:virulence-associated E family protein [Culicoidibacter larvae]TLG71390.1 hypothetical protein FEZ08_10880 [Culicoidibacter larvae]
MKNIEITIAEGKNRKSTKWKNKTITWPELVEKLADVIRTKETAAEYKKMSKTQQAEAKDVGGFVGGHLKNGRRLESNVVSRSLVTLDADFAPNDFIDTLELFHDFECVIYSTHSHTAKKARLRLVAPLNRDVDADEYQAIARKLAEKIGMDWFDDTTYQASRLMYYPSVSRDAEFIHHHIDGTVIDADAVLGEYKDWRDTSEWPESSRSEGIRKRHADKQGDPLEKDGIIGAFCRTYDIDAAIETFLPDVYIACDVLGRYTYVNGSSAAGLVIYDDKFAYSNHGTDPVGGKLCNAFDLVRIHLFGDQDEDSKPDTPVNRLPSFKAMRQFASNDVEVKLTIGRERLASAASEFDVVDDQEEDTDDSWLKELKTDNYTGEYVECIENFKLIITQDPNLKHGIVGMDTFKNNLVKRPDKLPWSTTGQYWSDTDDAGLRWYIERVYEMQSRQKIQDATDIVFAERQFHPVKEYLDTLVWDGTERASSIFIDYLGAADDEYTKTVSMMMLVAAVARIYRPGTKFDTMAVLVGTQGLGKSHLIAKLSKGWYTDTITTVSGKEAYESLDGAWLIEMAELTATRKAEVEAVKHFISKQEDTYRRAFARRVTTNKRQCVFFGTTNDMEFLRDRTGNRRFLPIVVSSEGGAKSVFDDLDDATIDQVWAEAIAAYKAGFPLYLSGDVADAAVERQQEHMEHDPRIGLIKDYLEKPLPDNWDDMNLGLRRDYISGHEDSITGKLVGVKKRMRVCAMEIWCELFERELRDFDNLKARDINSILNNIEGWERSEKSVRFNKRYGVQRGYFRINKM